MFLNTCTLSSHHKSRAQSMGKVDDPRDGETKEVRPKVARGMSLKACVATAAGWTLEKANPTANQATSINKAL